MEKVTIFDRDEIALFVALAGCSLDEKPGKNWVQKSGGLPEYICQIARAVKRSGHSTSQAIAIAVSRVKKWAAGADGVDADTRAKAAVALTQWEALKVKNKGRKAAKGAGKNDRDTVEATHHDVLCLANVDFNVNIVRSAFETQTREARRAWRKNNPNADYEAGPSHYYIREQWTSYLIVASEYGTEAPLFKISYTVDKDMKVTFGEPVQVTTQYVVVKDSDLPGAQIADADLTKALEIAAAASRQSLDAVVAATRPARSAVQQILDAHSQ